MRTEGGIGNRPIHIHIRLLVQKLINVGNDKQDLLLSRRKRWEFPVASLAPALLRHAGKFNVRVPGK